MAVDGAMPASAARSETRAVVAPESGSSSEYWDRVSRPGVSWRGGAPGPADRLRQRLERHQETLPRRRAGSGGHGLHQTLA